MKLCFLIILILITELLVLQSVTAKPLPPSEHIVSYEQFISGNDYAGEFISMSAKIKEIKRSGKGYGYTIQLMPLGLEETNKSVDVFVQVKNWYKREKDFIRDETIGIPLKNGYNIVVIGKAGDLKEKNRTIYVDTRAMVRGDNIFPLNKEGTIILLFKKDEYNEIKEIIHPKVLIHPKGEPMREATKYTYVVSRKIRHNMSAYADIVALGSYYELFLLDYNSELLDSDGDDVLDPIDPHPNEKDIDRDKLSDKEELELGTDPGKNDTDGDTLSDYTETHGFVRGGITFFTDPNNPDTDGDGIRDDKDSDPAPMDTDGDGLLDREELKIGTDVKKKDTDGDGLTDFEEVRGTRGYETDPFKKDTDGDRISDKEEIDRGLNPNEVDTDYDGLSDKKELDVGTNPKNSDTDGDGLTDFEEVRGTRGYETDPLKKDTDGDRISDKEEIDRGLNPNEADTDGDGINDSEDSFPMFNNNLIYTLSCIPVIVILVIFIIHNFRNKIGDASLSNAKKAGSIISMFFICTGIFLVFWTVYQGFVSNFRVFDSFSFGLGVGLIIFSTAAHIIILAKPFPTLTQSDDSRLEIYGPLPPTGRYFDSYSISNIDDVPEHAVCPYCQENIRESFHKYGGIVKCPNPECGAFHHKDCFRYGCGNPTCRFRKS